MDYTNTRHNFPNRDDFNDFSAVHGAITSWTIFIIFLSTAIILFGCVIVIWYIISRRKRRCRRGIIIQGPANCNLNGPSVTVTTTTHQPVPIVPTGAPGVSPPYPVDPRHPTPHSSGAPAPGFAAHNTPYPTNTPYHPQPGAAPYPPAHGAAPYPPSTGAPYPPVTNNAPYPPAAGNNSPPPYDVAVSQPPILPPAKEAYGKQSPYNPGYN